MPSPCKAATVGVSTQLIKNSERRSKKRLRIKKMKDSIKLSTASEDFFVKHAVRGVSLTMK